jgi:hypothetical protein
MGKDNRLQRDKALKELEQILAKRKKYVVTRVKQSRRDLGDNPTMNEMHLFLQTLVQDLQEMRILDK